MDVQFGHPSGKKLLEDIGKVFSVEETVFERKDKYTVFVCGGEVSHAANSLRAHFLKWAESELTDIIPLLAEQAYRESYSDQSPEFINLGKFEQLIAGVCDCVLIFPESVGSYAELGLFSAFAPLKKKVLVANEVEYHTKDSFLNLGPVQNIDASSLFRSTIPISRVRLDEGFSAVKERLARLKRRSKRRVFHYKIYQQLSIEDKLLAILATVTFLRAVTLSGLTISMRTTFAAANKRELQHLLSILVAQRYVLRSDDYFVLNPAMKPFVEFERISAADLISRATLYYTQHQPKTLERLRTIS
jgi:hypothetical protein